MPLKQLDKGRPYSKGKASKLFLGVFMASTVNVLIQGQMLNKSKNVTNKSRGDLFIKLNWLS